MNRTHASFLPRSLAALLLAGAPPLAAAQNVITTLVEDELANGNCTLREALLATIQQGPVDQCAGDSGEDEIVLAAVGVYELDDEDLPQMSSRSLVLRGAAGRPRSAYVIDLGGMQRLADVLSSVLTVEHLEIENGNGAIGGTARGGGTIYSENSALTLRDVRISGSRASGGGAIEAVHGSSLLIEGCEFTGNRVTAGVASGQRHGGALRLTWGGNAPLRLVSVRFADNEVMDLATGVSGFGGAVFLQIGSAANIDLRSLAFENNRIEVAGNGFGAGLFVDMHVTGGSFSLADALFTGNDYVAPTTAFPGSGAALDFGDVEAIEVRRLRAIGNGPGDFPPQLSVAVLATTGAVVSDVLVTDGAGTGIGLSVSGGGGLVAGNLTVTGQLGGGVGLYEWGGTLRLENSIVWNNTSEGGVDIDTQTTDPEVSSENLIGVDPGFADPEENDYRLGSASVAIDAGDATFASVGLFDLDHAPRRVGLDVDLGAYERNGLFADDFGTGDLAAWSDAQP